MMNVHQQMDQAKMNFLELIQKNNFFVRTKINV